MTNQEIRQTLAGAGNNPVSKAIIAMIDDHQASWLAQAITPNTCLEERQFDAGGAYAVDQLKENLENMLKEGATLLYVRKVTT